MPFFTEKNLFYAGMAYECAGVLSLAYAFFLRADDAGQAPRNRLVAWLLAGVHKAITPKNFDRVAAFLVIGTFFAAYVGQRIETATLQNGWVCADNLGNPLFLFLLVGMFWGMNKYIVWCHAGRQRWSDLAPA